MLIFLLYSKSVVKFQNLFNLQLFGVVLKKLYFISGTMGVGKTTVGNILRDMLPQSVLLEGDDCWTPTYNPSYEQKLDVLSEIARRLNALLADDRYRNVIFCWVMHLNEIHESILNSLHLYNYDVFDVSLTCSNNTLIQRLEKDISSGIRHCDVIERSVARLPLYDALNNAKVTTDGKTPHQIATEIIVRANAVTHKG